MKVFPPGSDHLWLSGVKTTGTCLPWSLRFSSTEPVPASSAPPSEMILLLPRSLARYLNALAQARQQTPEEVIALGLIALHAHHKMRLNWGGQAQLVMLRTTCQATWVDPPQYQAIPVSSDFGGDSQAPHQDVRLSLTPEIRLYLNDLEQAQQCPRERILQEAIAVVHGMAVIKAKNPLHFPAIIKTPEGSTQFRHWEMVWLAQPMPNDPLWKT